MPLSRSQRLANGASHAVGFFVLLGFGLASPVLPLLADDLGLTAASIGVAVGAFAVGRLVFGVTSLLGLTEARRMLHPVWVICGCLLTAAAAMWCALATDAVQLIAARGVQGIGSAMAMLAASIRPFVDGDHKNLGRRVGDQQTVFLLGTAVGPIIGGALGQFAGLQSPFWVTAALALCGIPCGILAHRLAPGLPAIEDVPLRSHAAAGRWAISVTAAGAGALTVIALANANRSAFRTTFFPLWGSDVLGLSETAIGVGLAVGALGFLAFALVGRLTDRVGPRPVLIGGGLTLALSTALVLVVPAVWSAYVAMVLSTIGASSAIVASTTAIIAGAEGPRRLIAVRNQRVATDVGMFAGPVAIGLALGAWDYTGALVSLTVLSLAIVAVGAVIRRPPFPLDHEESP